MICPFSHKMQSILMHTKYKHNIQEKNYASVVCVCNYISSKQRQALEIIPLACLSLEVLKGLLSLILNHLNYPYTINPNMWFVHEISQSINRNLTELTIENLYIYIGSNYINSNF